MKVWLFIRQHWLWLLVGLVVLYFMLKKKTVPGYLDAQSQKLENDYLAIKQAFDAQAAQAAASQSP